MEEITFADKTREAMQRQEIERLKQKPTQGCLEGHNKDWNEGYKAGIREVVQWVDGRLGITEAGLLSTNIDYIEWQAFKESKEVK